MKDEINILVFSKIDELAKRHGITDEVWAEHAGIRRPTISEMRRLLRANLRTPGSRTGRAFTAGKINKLFNGLLAIEGGASVKKGLIELINNEPDQNTRLLLLALLVQNAPQDSKDAAEANLRMAASTIDTHKK